MGWFYVTIEETNELYELAVTNSIDVSANSKISSEKTENKNVVSDNVVAYNPTISYNGIVSSIKSIGTNPRSLSTPEDYLEGIELARKTKKFVTCNIDASLNPIDNCQIKDFKYTKTEAEGKSSWKVSLVLQQVRTTVTATSTRIPTPAAKDITSEQNNAGNATTKQVDLGEAIPQGGILNIPFGQ